MSRTCRQPLPLEQVVAYMLGELTDPEAGRVEEHYFSCEACTRKLETVRRLGEGIAQLVRGGHVSASVTEELLACAQKSGLTLRAYHLAPGGQVACTASPADDFVVVRLALSVAESEVVDLTAVGTEIASGAQQSRTVQDVVVDRVAGEVIYLYSGAYVRALPRTRWTLSAQVRGPAGERQVGPFTMNHTPWEELSHPQ